MITGNDDMSANAFLFDDSDGPWKTETFIQSLENEMAKGLGF